MPYKLDWYVFQLNTPENFNSFQKLVSSIIPKGCSVLSLSVIKPNEYWSSKLDRKMTLTNYVFILCNLKLHAMKIIRSLRSFEIEAEILKDMDNKPVKLTKEEISHIIEMNANSRNSELIDDTYSLGDTVKVVSGPLKGFMGNISLITFEHVYCPIKIKRRIVNIPLLREDIEKIK